MTDILEERNRKLQSQRLQDGSDYRKYIEKIASGKPVKVHEGFESVLERLQRRLGLTEDVFEKKLAADVAVLKQHAALTAAIAPRSEIVATIAAIEKDADAFRDKETKLLAELAADAQGINSRLAAENNRLAVVDRAAEQLGALENANWGLLSFPDPALEATKRHLVQVVFKQPTNPPYSLVALEAVMNDPKTWATQFRPDNPAIWVPVAEQTEADLQMLLALARQLVTGEKVAHYILPNSEAERPKFHTNSVMYADLNKRLNPDQRYFIGEYAWIPAPGQSVEQFEKCRGAITRKEQFRTDNVTTTLMEQNNKSSWATLPGA